MNVRGATLWTAVGIVRRGVRADRDLVGVQAQPSSWMGSSNGVGDVSFDLGGGGSTGSGRRRLRTLRNPHVRLLSWAPRGPSAPDRTHRPTDPTVGRAHPSAEVVRKG